MFGFMCTIRMVHFSHRMADATVCQVVIVNPPPIGEQSISGVNASSRLVGTSLVSRLSACLTEANWWRLIAE